MAKWKKMTEMPKTEATEKKAATIEAFRLSLHVESKLEIFLSQFVQL